MRAIPLGVELGSHDPRSTLLPASQQACDLMSNFESLDPQGSIRRVHALLLRPGEGQGQRAPTRLAPRSRKLGGISYVQRHGWRRATAGVQGWPDFPGSGGWAGQPRILIVTGTEPVTFRVLQESLLYSKAFLWQVVAGTQTAPTPFREPGRDACLSSVEVACQVRKASRRRERPRRAMIVLN